ncbi:5-aminolevulinate synthase [Haematospirillum sp. 15-248]|uniref:5-aminolevulinate synthase n=1 Tax=Haematospirillum sp. 15-248 TaxID=2723107 RepID=UPI00143A0C3F|nr:5-aminolevulinate synthase [Haematospirillum sp. 15-248]NKD86836.1 5-aminolevulinate synthase [Haematospirillum sp. 15-248]
MNYDDYFRSRLDGLRSSGNYRIFADLERYVDAFPKARSHRNGTVQDITIWCSNDYLAMGVSPMVREAMKDAIDRCGGGAGGTRNISGTNHYHVLLEQELADWHNKEAALLFTSGYIANMTTLMTLGSQIPGMVLFSDSDNHNSMIEGIRHSRAPKHIWKHNDYDDLHRQLSQHDRTTPKLVIFESVYSMDGDIAPLEKIIDVAEHHNAMTFLDEVHAVGMYGEQGSGVAERDGVRDRVDIIQATMGKAVGTIGGYITAKSHIVDFVRSFGAGFIFTTSLPPAVAAGALASIRWLRTHNTIRECHQERARTLKQRLQSLDIPVMASESHIVPVMVGDPALCKQASDELLEKHGIYVQPINYPTVPKGTERLRFTPTPRHTDEHIDHLCRALVEVWEHLGIKAKAAAA